MCHLSLLQYAIQTLICFLKQEDAIQNSEPRAAAEGASTPGDRRTTALRTLCKTLISPIVGLGLGGLGVTCLA